MPERSAASLIASRACFFVPTNRRSRPAGQLAGELLRVVQQPLGLLQVDDVDAAALAEDEAAHLGVPAARLVAEVNPGLQQLLDAYLGGQELAPLSWCRCPTAGSRTRARFPGQGRGRSTRRGS